MVSANNLKKDVFLCSSAFTYIAFRSAFPVIRNSALTAPFGDGPTISDTSTAALTAPCTGKV